MNVAGRFRKSGSWVMRDMFFGEDAVATTVKNRRGL